MPAQPTSPLFRARLLRRGLLLAALVLSGTGSASAEPGEGIQIGKTLLTPYVEAAITYDANVMLEKDAESDTVLGATLGAGAERAGEAGSVGAEVWGRVLRYGAHKDRDADLVGESLRVSTLLFDRFNLSVGQRYETSIEDQEFLTGLFGTVRQFIGSLSVGQQLSERTSLVLSYERSQADFELEELYDWSRESGAVSLEHKATDRTTAFAGCRVSLQHSEGSGDAVLYGAGVGFRTELTDKTAGTASLGWEYQDADEVISFPRTDGSLTWEATDRASVNLAWGLSLRPAIEYRDNSIVSGRIQLGGGIELTETVRMDLSVAYRQDRYWNDVTTRRDETGELVIDIREGRAILTYAAPLRWLTLFTEANYTDQSTSLDIRQYDRYRITVGARVTY